jgi:hypothetical protein
VSITKNVSPRGRFSEWLLLEHPLLWRQRPVLGLGLVAMWLALIFLTAFAEPYFKESASVSVYYMARLALLTPLGPLMWAWWYFLRTRFPCNAISVRRLLLGPFLVDLTIWLAFFLASLFAVALNSREGTLKEYGMPLLFVHGILPLFIAATAMLQVRLKELLQENSSTLFRWLRWDLLLPAFLRKRAQSYETKLAIDHPMRWSLMLHRYFAIALYMCAVQWILKEFVVAILSDEALAAVIVLYPLMFLLLYWIAARSNSASILLRHISSWLWVLCDALFIIAVAYLVLIAGRSHSSLPFSEIFPLLPLPSNSDMYSANRWLWATPWILVTYQIIFSWPHTKLNSIKSKLPYVGAFMVALVGPNSLPIEATVMLGMLWCIGAAYLAWSSRRPRGLAIDLMVALFLIASATGFVTQHILWPIGKGVALWQDLAVNVLLALLLRAGALNVIRARAVLPRSE